MKIKKFNIYLANLDPSFGTEPGKVRPVVVIQTDYINDLHHSTVVCPLTSKLIKEAGPLRLRLKSQESGLSGDSDVLIDQIRAIDNRRFKKHLGFLAVNRQVDLTERLQMLLFE